MSLVGSIGPPHSFGARVIWGVLLLAAPGGTLRAMGGSQVGVGSTRVMRVLGVRQLAEAVIDARYPSARRWVAAVDGIHACTAVGFAVVSPRWRRAAIADAAVAATLTVMGARELDRRPGPRSLSDGRGEARRAGTRR